MDANFIRFLIEEARPLLEGARIQKIYSPARGIWSLKLSSKINMTFSHLKRERFLFFSPYRPESPLMPSSGVMWWRKRLKNKRITSVENMWPQRRLLMEIAGMDARVAVDLAEGISLVKEGPHLHKIIWPSLSEIEERRDIYRDYPHVTSVLRYALMALEDREERRIWYERLIKGDIDRFYLYKGEGTVAAVISLWPREDLRKRFDEHTYSSALALAEEYGLSIIEGMQLQGRGGEEKRQRRTLRRLQRDIERAREAIGRGEIARLIQRQLYLYSPSGHYKEVKVQDEGGREYCLEMDPALSLVENLEQIFKRAKKASRALVHLERRIEEVSSRGMRQGGPQWGNARAPSNDNHSPSILPRRLQKIKVKTFLSSDGYLIVRGRNQRANHLLLTRGSRPYDMWFHVEGGPGAHVIVVRENPRRELPFTTKMEAAQLAVLSSYAKDSTKATVLCSEVRYVKQSRERPIGEVEVLKVLETLVVAPDPELEERLAC